jgi:hypothetical protein
MLICEEDTTAALPADNKYGDYLEDPEEAIDHMLSSLKLNHAAERMVGIREEDHVMVYNR